MFFWVSKTKALGGWEGLCELQVLKAHVSTMSLKELKSAWAWKAIMTGNNKDPHRYKGLQGQEKACVGLWYICGPEVLKAYAGNTASFVVRRLKSMSAWRAFVGQNLLFKVLQIFCWIDSFSDNFLTVSDSIRSFSFG